MGPGLNTTHRISMMAFSREGYSIHWRLPETNCIFTGGGLMHQHAGAPCGQIFFSRSDKFAYFGDGMYGLLDDNDGNSTRHMNMTKIPWPLPSMTAFILGIFYSYQQI